MNIRKNRKIGPISSINFCKNDLVVYFISTKTNQVKDIPRSDKDVSIGFFVEYVSKICSV
jgi:hypothetical protein